MVSERVLCVHNSVRKERRISVQCERRLGRDRISKRKKKENMIIDFCLLFAVKSKNNSLK